MDETEIETFLSLVFEEEDKGLFPFKFDLPIILSLDLTDILL